MDFIYGLFIFAIAVFILAAILQVIAKRQLDFHLIGAPVDETAHILTTSGVLRGGWKPANGRGQINIRPGLLLGGRKGRPVLSMDLEEDDEGTHVQIWLSAWVSKWGVMEPFQSTMIILRRNKIVKALRAVCEAAV
jgi:hypothetical protein